MAHEWQVGDRFSVEGVVTETADSDGDYQAIFDGHTTDGCVIAAEMAHAKLIKPAAPEPQRLDTSKPIRIKNGVECLYYIGKDRKGYIHYQWDDGTCGVATEKDLENITEPKIMGRREAFLAPDGELYWVSSWPDNHPLEILGRTWVEITEGAPEGQRWGIEEGQP